MNDVQRILAELALLSCKVDAVLVTLNVFEGVNMKELDDLKAQVAQQVTVEKSAIVLINRIPQLIADAVAKTNGDVAGLQQALKDINAGLTASAADLAAAVVANTPAAEPPPAPPAPETPPQ